MKKRTNKLHVNVTEEDYQQGLAQGLPKEDLLKPGRHTFTRGGFRKRHPDFMPSMTEPRNIKVCVTIRLDLDVLNYFKDRAAQPNAGTYETQINRKLRDIMEHDTKTDGDATSEQSEAVAVDHDVKTVVGRKSISSARKNEAGTHSKPRRYNLIPTDSPTSTHKRNMNSRKSNRSNYLKQINNSLSASSIK